MKKGLFITATSTGVGKTVISAFLIRILAENEVRVAYYKPIQTGGIYSKKKIISVDCRFIENVLIDFPKCKTYYSYIFKKPASPHYAARLEKASINLNKIKSDYKMLSKTSNIIITEGAGGLCVPIDEKNTFIAQLPKLIKINVVLVSNAGLGAINQVLLSYYYAKSVGINIASIILISYEKKQNDIETDNLRMLKKLLKMDSVYIIPAVVNIDTERNKAGDFFKKIKYFPDINHIKSWINE